jgi:uncharacterized repeat protein (TIGR02543 family)
LPREPSRGAGGTNPADAPASYTAESLPVTLPAPIRDGHIFAGWYGDAVTAIPAGSTGDKTFWAKWDLSLVQELERVGTEAAEGGAYTITIEGGASERRVGLNAEGISPTKAAGCMWMAAPLP